MLDTQFRRRDFLVFAAALLLAPTPCLAAEPLARRGTFVADVGILYQVLKFHREGGVDESIDREAGRYEVRLAYMAHPNRASNVPVTIESADGKRTVSVDERTRPPIDGTFVSLGVYRFTPEKEAVVTVRNDGTDGFVVIDAVQLLAVK